IWKIQTLNGVIGALKFIPLQSPQTKNNLQSLFLELNKHIGVTIKKGSTLSWHLALKQPNQMIFMVGTETTEPTQTRKWKEGEHRAPTKKI
ncbi:hypothetical protein MKW98_005705, partial [Papaver atlanticum]